MIRRCLAHIDWICANPLPLATSLLTGGIIRWVKPMRSEGSKLKGGLNGLLLLAIADRSAT
jgi:hypothetical protein